MTAPEADGRRVAFGVQLLARATAVEALLRDEAARPFCAIYLNFHSYAALRTMGAELGAVSAVTFDGSAMPFVLRSLGVASTSLYRQSFDFSGVADVVFASAVEGGWKVVLVGGSEDEIASASAAISARHPGLNVAMAISGYRAAEDLEKLCESAGADLIVIGLGHLRQERLAVRVYKHARVGVMTCGAFLSQTAAGGSDGDYYPMLVRRFGGRWMYRLFREPRLVRRLVIEYPKGLFVLLWDVLRADRI